MKSEMPYPFQEKENVESYTLIFILFLRKLEKSAGAIPVVVGAPNIQDFAPSPHSVLHIKEVTDVPSIAKTMKYLAANPDAYNQSLR